MFQSAFFLRYYEILWLFLKKHCTRSIMIPSLYVPKPDLQLLLSRRFLGTMEYFQGEIMILKFSLFIGKHDYLIKLLHSKAQKHSGVTSEFCMDSQNKSFSQASKRFSHLPPIMTEPLCVLKDSDLKISHDC